MREERKGRERGVERARGAGLEDIGEYARMRFSEEGKRKEATIAWRTDVGLCAETTYAIAIFAALDGQGAQGQGTGDGQLVCSLRMAMVMIKRPRAISTFATDRGLSGPSKSQGFGSTRKPRSALAEGFQGIEETATNI